MFGHHHAVVVHDTGFNVGSAEINAKEIGHIEYFIELNNISMIEKGH
jgi:hypothetical protein